MKIVAQGRFAAAVVAIALAAAVACGGGDDSTGLASSSPAPDFNLTGVTPGLTGSVEISNDSRQGQVTVLYFSFVG